ncbi:MAG: NADH dehydrogenase FAD-containing subunit [Candidatus Wallbacteria bacterium]|nr:NADH dehydrogenase FAD-containing subunit [Candidatus Wallbacteria bacterium]
MVLLALVLIPALTGLAAVVLGDAPRQLRLLLGAAVTHLTLTAALWSFYPMERFGGMLMLDAAGLLFLSITSLQFLFAAIYSVSYVQREGQHAGSTLRWFIPCLLWFLAAMTLVTVSGHLALLWAATEASTLASAPLVYFYRRRGALEAAWKYLILCSVGIALALLGTLLISVAAPGRPGGLGLNELLAAAPLMSRPWLVAAFVLALVGYGTKMGLAPLHYWLPDTHSQAPSPVCALLSGALLNCAFLGILRFHQVCLAAGHGDTSRLLMLLFGFLSMAVAAIFLFGQQDYKRLLAYSSIENMGILAVGTGLGGAAVHGAMLHAVNHSLVKGCLFFLAGNVLAVTGTTDAAAVRGLLRQVPRTGLLFCVLTLAIGGCPPFGPFMSELMVARGALFGVHPWLGALFVFLLALAFAGLAGTVIPMLQGRPDSASRPAEPTLTLVSPLCLAGLALLLGLYVPTFLSNLLASVSWAMGGGV